MNSPIMLLAALCVFLSLGADAKTRGVSHHNSGAGDKRVVRGFTTRQLQMEGMGAMKGKEESLEEEESEESVESEQSEESEDEGKMVSMILFILVCVYMWWVVSIGYCCNHE